MNEQTIFHRALGFAGWGALLTGLLVIGGCGGGTLSYRASATTTTTAPQPQMVQVSPGVWAVAEYDQPVFYSNDAYWRYENGYWYRSSYLGGWTAVSVDVVPRPVVVIDRPARYRRYRARSGVRVRRVPPGHVRVRARPPARRAQPQRRIERRRDRQDRRIERRRDRQDRRIERRRGRRDVVVRPR